MIDIACDIANLFANNFAYDLSNRPAKWFANNPVCDIANSFDNDLDYDLVNSFAYNPACDTGYHPAHDTANNRVYDPAKSFAYDLANLFNYWFANYPAFDTTYDLQIHLTMVLPIIQTVYLLMILLIYFQI